jgi:hypothetical protein
MKDSIQKDGERVDLRQQPSAYTQLACEENDPSRSARIGTQCAHFGHRKMDSVTSAADAQQQNASTTDNLPVEVTRE